MGGEGHPGITSPPCPIRDSVVGGSPAARAARRPGNRPGGGEGWGSTGRPVPRATEGVQSRGRGVRVRGHQQSAAPTTFAAGYPYEPGYPYHYPYEPVTAWAPGTPPPRPPLLPTQPHAAPPPSGLSGAARAATRGRVSPRE